MQDSPGNTATTDILDEKEFHRVKAQLINKSGLSYIEFKKKLTPVYSQVWMDISLGWIGIGITLTAAVLLLRKTNAGGSIMLSLLTAAIIGYLIAYLINFFHEAAHYNIAAHKKLNDRLANLFLGIFIAQGIKNYRIVHWQHHIALGTPEDSEISYFESLDLRFFLLSLSGISAITFFFNRNKFIAASSKEDPVILEREKQRQVIASLFFHVAILVILFYFSSVYAMIAWMLAAGSFYPFFNRLRQLMEHRSDKAAKHIDYRHKPHGKLSRIFGNSLFDRSFGSAGFNKHLLHHLEPGISYTRLDEMEAFLKETMASQSIKNKKTSYSRTFIKLFNR